MDELNEKKYDLAQVVRLALAEQTEDVRLFAARLVRKYRGSDPELASQIDSYLRSKPQRGKSILRKPASPSLQNQPLPIDDESRLTLLRAYSDPLKCPPPLLSNELKDSFEQLIQERKQADRLIALGLSPTRSAIFVGPPGVGKTLTARWLSTQLDLPLYVLDLTAVMSSLLGKSGSNLRAALDFAKRSPCVLLLDEIDAIAKRRGDDADVGELKRLVTVILQEIDEWPDAGLLLAATNHSELIDPAIWRRFDFVAEFKAPEKAAIKEAIRRFLGPDLELFIRWIDVLTLAFKGQPISNIEKSIQRFRRSVALGVAVEADLVEDFIKKHSLTLNRQERIDMAILLSKEGRLSQHSISHITGVSRDTIRKYSKSEPSVLA